MISRSPFAFLLADGALDAHFRMRTIRCAMGYDSLDKIDRQLAAAGNPLPNLDLDLRLLGANHVSVGVFDLLVNRLGMFVIVNPNILTPSRFDLDPFDIAVDTKRHPEARRDEGLVA